ncbi:MAG: ROK family protein [Candidatus Micrarchaeota archaeon]|nr:ROK family protein [Candidatus Micrarchaeota archaeon]
MRHAIGLDIGATHIRATLGNEKGELKGFISEKTDNKGIEQQIYRLLDSYSDYECIGIGSMGPLDSFKGIITNPPNINIRNLRIVELLEKKYGVASRLLNDCAAGVYGERAFGAGKNLENLSYVTMSTGIGAGVIQDGRLLFGKDGNGHEIGHCEVDADIRLKCRCNCLARHWEAYGAGINIPNFVEQMLLMKYKGKNSRLRQIRNMTAKDLFDAAEDDKVAAQLLDDLGRINASGIANVVNAYDPELITIGGSVALNNQRQILDPIKRYISEYTINRLPKVMITPLGKDVILAGAVAYILDATKDAE